MGTANKGRWYRLLIAKMDQAIVNKYYFEAIFIEYMIIDDRLKTLCSIAGVNLMKDDNKPKMVGQLIDDLKDAKDTQTVPQWKQLDIEIPLADKAYLKAIKKEKYPQDKIYECTHAPMKLVNYEQSKKSGKYLSKYHKGAPTLLGQLKEWVEYRNHWMHAAGDDALTKEEYESEITPLAIDGASFAKEMCNVTNRIKNGIRAKKKRKAAAAATKNVD